MPRKILKENNLYPYHVTARTNNCDWFAAPIAYCFGVYANVIGETISRYGIELHAFVLMSNHFHMIISTPNKNIALALRYFMTETSRGIRYKSERINHIYGGRNYKSTIENAEYYAHCIKYVFRNPVRAGLVDRVEDYPWSTISKTDHRIQGLLSEAGRGLDAFIPKGVNERLSWFNKDEGELLREQLALAIKRPEFKFKTSPKSKKKIDPKTGLYCEVPG